MSNKIYDDTLYNEGVKLRFLNMIAEEKHSLYKGAKSVLSRASKVEEMLNKDLYDFNLEEIEDFLNYLDCGTVSSLQNRVYHIKLYIGWAIQEGCAMSNINPVAAISTNAYYKKLTGNRQRFITEDDLRRMLRALVNYQDKALLHAIFEGIYGNQKSEIGNLKRDDIDREHLAIMLYGSRTTRMLQMDNHELIDDLLCAAKEMKYDPTNGRLHREEDKIDIYDNDYIFRNFRDVREADKPIREHTVHDRIARMKQFLYPNYQFIKSINIRDSGMLRYAKHIYVEKGVLDTSDIIEVCERYNVSHLNNNWNRLKADFMNVETIRSVYVLD